jgi:small subunit ribosomal protein S3
MGQKVNPKVIRLNTTVNWQSRWIVRGRDFSKTLQEDTIIREFLKKKLIAAGVDSIEIERYNDDITVIIKTTRPGMIIGRGGGGIEEIKKQLRKNLKVKKNVKINIEEVKNANLAAQVWATTIAEQLEKRVSHRRAIKQAVENIMEAGGKGVRICVKGRLGGAEIARTEWLYKGSLPLHTLRADIDYGTATAYTTYGTIGVKVWINRGLKFEDKNSKKES